MIYRKLGWLNWEDWCWYHEGNLICLIEALSKKWWWPGGSLRIVDLTLAYLALHAHQEVSLPCSFVNTQSCRTIAKKKKKGLY